MMKWIVLMTGLVLTSVLPYLPIEDKDAPLDKVFTAQMAGLVIASLALLRRDH